MFKILLCSFTALLFYGSHTSASIVNIKDKVAARVRETQNEKKIYPVTYFLDKLRQSYNLNHIWDTTTVSTELPQEVTEIVHHPSYYFPTYFEAPPNPPVHHYPKSVDKPFAYRMPESYETALNNSHTFSYGRHKVEAIRKVDAAPRSRISSGRKTSSHRESAKISRKTTTIAPLRKTTTTKPTTKTSPTRTKTTTTRRSPKRTTTTMAPTRKTNTTPRPKRITTTTRTTTRRPKTTTTTTTTTTRRPKTKKTTTEATTTRRTIKLQPLSPDQETMMEKMRDVTELKNLVHKFRHRYHVKYTERHNSSKKTNTTQPDVTSPHHHHHKSPLFKITTDSAINNNYVWEMNQMMNKIQSRYSKYDPQINEVIRSAASALTIYGATKPEKSEIIDMHEYPPLVPTTSYTRPGAPVTLQQNIYRYPLVVNKTSAIDF